MSIEKNNSIIAPKLSVVFSEERECNRVTSTLEKLPWLREHGYGESNMRVPNGITEQSNAKEICDAVSAEFSEELYKDFAHYIEKRWLETSISLGILKEIPAFQLRDSYTVILTCYGTGGSYNSQNGVIVINIKTRTKEKIMGTIVHEIIHIGIQHLVDKYKVKHWQKERLVDLIGAKYFSEMRKMQNITEDITMVDSAFDNFFPDVDAIARRLGEA